MNSNEESIMNVVNEWILFEERAIGQFKRQQVVDFYVKGSIGMVGPKDRKAIPIKNL